ncbi:MAG: TIGR03936 family radical SAM-associated protein [Syntrophomonadaceae bacterium]|nr:TIGR03936 family radical SAM-associated protein [Syntrophomonadaceae bacterium]
MPRFRIEYSKKGPVAFISHLDLARVWERAARRANLPVALSRGFHPHYRISLGSVLPVGMEGEREYLELELREQLAPLEVKRALEEQLPEGIGIARLVPVAEPASSLMAVIDTAEYRFQLQLMGGFSLSESELAGRWREMCERPRWPVTRRDKKGEREVDVRPGLLQAEMKLKEGSAISGVIWLRVGGENPVRPREVLQAMEKYAQLPLDWEQIVVRRTGLYVTRGGKWISPLYA